MKDKKIFVFTHYDVDGAVSYLTLKWTFSKLNIPYQTTTVKRFREDFTNWLTKNNVSDYDKIFILDLDVSEHADLIDKKNVFIIDHHKSHEEAAKYENATAVVKEYTSAAKLIYKVFNKLYDIKLTDAQKKLILLADDYDSYKLDLPDSSKLNMIFWETNGKFNDFVKTFAGGFNGFNYKQESIVKFYNTQVDRIKNKMPVYTGKVKIQGDVRNVCASFAEKYINDIADILIKDYNADIAIVVNKKTNHISFRKPNNLDGVDVSKLAAKLADGAGHEYSAGGSITKNFLSFTKLLKQIR